MKSIIPLSLLFLLGCNPNFNDGVIINKPYIPEYTTVDFIYIYNASTENFDLMPITKKVPEQFQFVIEKSIDNETFTKTINVSKETYKSYNTFDYYPRAEDIN